ncbi:hypothetical protein JB92DRAFT_2952874, partial [Gautieria morchelliformis]
FLLIGTAAFLVCCAFPVYSDRPSHVDLQGEVHWPPYNTRVPSDQVLALPNNANSRTLGVACLVFVLSLPRRIDRRIMTMDTLQVAHTLDFEFVYRTGRSYRCKCVDQVRSCALSDTPIPGVHEYEGTLGLSCATPEGPFPVLRTKLEFGILSGGAAWHGRLLDRSSQYYYPSNTQPQLEVAIVLEDDVDLEYDMSSRLMDMGPTLPRDGWDIVMLGQCHSNESMYRSLLGAPSLHPSFAPKCTQRLTRMVSTRFAYSRAIDEAISWVISTGRIRSYRVVPAIVQRQRGHCQRYLANPSQRQSHHQEGQRGSDASDKGSKWSDVLMASPLQKLVMKDTKVT